MTPDRLDFSLYETAGLLVIAPSGRLDADSGAALRAKVQSLAQSRRTVVLDLLRVVSISDEAVLQILSLESDLRGAGGELALLVTSDDALSRLEPWRNLFQIHPSLASLLATGFQGRGIKWSRRTGFRLAPPVAIALGAILAGWMATLMVLVLWQFRALQSEGGELEKLRGEEAKSRQAIAQYQERLKPLEDLGLLDEPRARFGRNRSLGADSTAEPSTAKTESGRSP
jgi:anti-anti-sigma regulatory factor